MIFVLIWIWWRTQPSERCHICWSPEPQTLQSRPDKPGCKGDDGIFGDLSLINTFLMKNLVDSKTDKAKVIHWSKARFEEKRFPTEDLDYIGSYFIYGSWQNNVISFLIFNFLKWILLKTKPKSYTGLERKWIILDCISENHMNVWTRWPLRIWIRLILFKGILNCIRAEFHRKFLSWQFNLNIWTS